MKQLIYIILFLLSWQVQGQEEWKMETYPVTSNYVIAVPGLNMRTSPRLDGKKVAYVPYSNEVKILEPHKFSRDTVGEVKNYHKGNQQGKFPNPVIEGYWVKASYQGNVGYIFSAYLTNTADRKQERMYRAKIETPDINKDYVLLYEGAGCRGNYHFDEDWYYYAAQKTPNGICLEPTELSFTQSLEYNEFQTMRITSDIQDYYPVCIIGSRYPLSENEINTPTDLNINALGGDSQLNETLLGELFVKPIDGQYASDLILNRNGQTQVLNPFTDPEKTNKNNPRHINFKGDLDGDGQDDYIISFGEKFSQTVLYLSSEAVPGQLVKPVAVWYDGYCC